MATYNSPAYALNGPIAAHGEATEAQHLHTTVTIGAAPTTADVINYGYLPANAVVVSAVLKNSDMDTNGSPTVTWNVGITGTAQLFFAASTGAQTGTADVSMASAGRLYKNLTGAKVAVVGSLQANPATGAAGTSELCLTYFVEE